MKLLFRQLAIGHWRLLKPSEVTSKDSEVNMKEKITSSFLKPE